MGGAVNLAVGCTGVTGQRIAVLLGGFRPQGILQYLSLGLQQLLHIRGKLLPALQAHGVKADRPVHRQVVHMARHVVPLGGIARAHAGHRTVDDAGLHGGDHFGERQGNGGGAECADHVGHVAATYAHLAALEVVQGVHGIAAEKHLRGIGHGRQQLDAVALGHTRRQHRLVGIGDLA